MDELKPIENPLESLSLTVPFSSKDWGIEKRDAWVYGIICGWDDNCFPEFERKFGWNKGTFERLKRLHSRFEGMRRPAPENKPLTLEQLRKMDGEPVWVEHFDSPCSIEQPGEWLILKSCDPTREHPYVDFKDKALCALYYGQGWLAYARKPEQEGKS